MSDSLLAKVSGLRNDRGDARVKRIVHRVVLDLFKTIEEFDIQPDEFWSAMSYLSELGQTNEVGLLVPGLGLETFLDLRTDAAEHKAGIEGGTPRTIEGPLYGGCLLESSIGAAAHLQVFAGLRELAWGCEHFGPQILVDDLVEEPLRFADFGIHLPAGSGLGVTLDQNKLHRYARG
jgi:hypothetical protein